MEQENEGYSPEKSRSAYGTAQTIVYVTLLTCRSVFSTNSSKGI